MELFFVKNALQKPIHQFFKNIYARLYLQLAAGANSILYADLTWCGCVNWMCAKVVGSPLLHPFFTVTISAGCYDLGIIFGTGGVESAVKSRFAGRGEISDARHVVAIIEGGVAFGQM